MSNLDKKARFDRNSELLICAAQFFVVLLVFSAYLISPKFGSPWVVPPVTAICTTLFILLGFRVYLIRGNRGDTFLMGFILIENIALGALIWSFHIQYEAPPGLSLQSPSFVFFFVFTALRSLRFQARYVLASGGFAILTWLTMLLLASNTSGTEFTRSFREYVESSKVLIGAEVEKMLALALFTGVLAFAMHRARNLLNQGVDAEKEKNRLLGELVQKANEKNDEKTQFLHLMHHELKTPLTAIIGYSGLLLMDKEDSMELNFIQSQGKHLLRLIERILYFIEVSEVENKDLEEVSWSELSTVLLAKFEKAERKVELSIEGDNATLLVARERLNYALWEFIENAAFVCEKGLIQVVQKDLGNIQSISIRDKGPGLSKEQLERALNLFTQKENAFKRSQESIGLGIPLAIRLIESMGGTCTVSSEEGQGTEIEINIPKKVA